MEATGLTRLQLAHGRTWYSPSLPRRGRDDPVVVLLEPLPQALVGRWPDQLEAHRAQANVDIGQLPRELARRHLDLDHGVAALLERTKHEGTALRDRRLERPEQVRGPEADVLDAFAVLLQERTPLARLAGDRLDQLEGETRPGAPAVGDAHGKPGLRLAEVPMIESEHPLIAVHDCVQVPHDNTDVKRDDVWWCAHDGSPSCVRVLCRGCPRSRATASSRWSRGEDTRCLTSPMPRAGGVPSRQQRSAVSRHRG